MKQIEDIYSRLNAIVIITVVTANIIVELFV